MSGHPLPRLKFRKSQAVLALLVLRRSPLPAGEGPEGGVARRGVERDWPVSLGMCAADLGRWEEAAAHFAQSLRLSGSGEYEDVIHNAWGLTVLAKVALARGRLAWAARLLGVTELLWARRTHRDHLAARRQLERNASAVRAQMEAAEFEAAWAAGQSTPLDQIIAEVLEEAPAG